MSSNCEGCLMDTPENRCLDWDKDCDEVENLFRAEVGSLVMDRNTFLCPGCPDKSPEKCSTLCPEWNGMVFILECMRKGKIEPGAPRRTWI